MGAEPATNHDTRQDDDDRLVVSFVNPVDCDAVRVVRFRVNRGVCIRVCSRARIGRGAAVQVQPMRGQDTSEALHDAERHSLAIDDSLRSRQSRHRARALFIKARRNGSDNHSRRRDGRRLLLLFRRRGRRDRRRRFLLVVVLLLLTLVRRRSLLHLLDIDSSSQHTSRTRHSLSSSRRSDNHHTWHVESRRFRVRLRQRHEGGREFNVVATASRARPPHNTRQYRVLRRRQRPHTRT